MAKQRKSAAKIAHQRRKSKRKPSSRKKKEPQRSLFPSRRLFAFALILFVCGYGGTLVVGLFGKGSSEEKELTPSVVSTYSEPSLFDRVIDRLLDKDLPHLRKNKPVKKQHLSKPEPKVVPKKIVKPTAVTKRAELPALNLVEEKKMAKQKNHKAHLSQKDKKKLDQLLSKYGF